jgi:ATPase subunit of ABC transporter with duplicated ATPase domains
MSNAVSGGDPDVEEYQRQRAERRARLEREEAEEAEKFRKAMAAKVERERLAKEAAARAEKEKMAKEKAVEAVRRRREQVEKQRLEEERSRRVAGKVSVKVRICRVLTGGQRKAQSSTESNSDIDEVGPSAPKVSTGFRCRTLLTLLTQ